ncbi:uncharacterized protein C8Q71DRAFT_38458 [Rhodofomes roseus]|uniref:Uncharacterized protein n=1 Tax=Rhodofomes roseus TaxID=34475 RepID=A0ABQ8KY96_9APHY|nr:uncharacterized protein C8Q71DRAFT_38458 [Rhodofomes roseus]KAH9844279.1 hypothetical protein C8Q71DRAFT_38458 [Rhodofomes roseus]
MSLRSARRCTHTRHPRDKARLRNVRVPIVGYFGLDDSEHSHAAASAGVVPGHAHRPHTPTLCGSRFAVPVRSHGGRVCHPGRGMDDRSVLCIPICGRWIEPHSVKWTNGAGEPLAHGWVGSRRDKCQRGARFSGSRCEALCGRCLDNRRCREWREAVTGEVARAVHVRGSCMWRVVRESSITHHALRNLTVHSNYVRLRQ